MCNRWHREGSVSFALMSCMTLLNNADESSFGRGQSAGRANNLQILQCVVEF